MLGGSEGPKQEPRSSFRSCWWIKAGAPHSTTPAVPSPKSVCVGGTDSRYDPFLLERPEIWPLVDISLTQLLQERLVIPWGQIEQQPEVTNEQKLCRKSSGGRIWCWGEHPTCWPGTEDERASYWESLSPNLNVLFHRGQPTKGHGWSLFWE